VFDQGHGKTTSRIIKTILNKLLFFTAKNDFTKYISINRSQVKFFTYCSPSANV
jgi:hypothetical protein